MEKLELAKNILCPIYLSPTVLDKGLDHYFAYTIENEKEIFIERPLNKRNLGQELTKRLEELENLREKNQKLEKDDILNQATIINLQEEIAYLEEKLNTLQLELSEKEEEVNNLDSLV